MAINSKMIVIAVLAFELLSESIVFSFFLLLLKVRSFRRNFNRCDSATGGQILHPDCCHSQALVLIGFLICIFSSFASQTSQLFKFASGKQKQPEQFELGA